MDYSLAWYAVRLGAALWALQQELVLGWLT